MRIPTWRLVLTGGAIVLLLGLGVGLVAASTFTQGPTTAAAAAPGASANTNENANHHGLRRLGRVLSRLGKLGPGARHFVDGSLTFTDKDGQLVTIQLDHGRIATIDAGRIVIDEAGGKQVTLSTDGATVVRLGGGAGLGKVGDLKVGDEVFVQSRQVGAATIAKHILRVPAAGTQPAPSPGG